MLEDSDDLIHRSALNALIQCSECARRSVISYQCHSHSHQTLIPMMLHLLAHSLPRIRCAALCVLERASLHDDAEIVRAVLARASDDEPSVRRFAIRALATLSNDNDGCIDIGVAAGLGDSDVLVRKVAEETLVKLSHRNTSIEGKMLGLLHHNNGNIRRGATKVLKQVAKNYNVLISRLASGLHRRDMHIRWTLEALRRLGSRGDKNVIAAGLELIEDQEWRVRHALARFLGMIATDQNEDAINALFVLLDDDHPHVCNIASNSLSAIVSVGNVSVIVALISRLMHRQLHVQQAAMTALELILGNVSLGVFPALFERLSHSKDIINPYHHQGLRILRWRCFSLQLLSRHES